jgi:hypothetical protein
MRFIYLRYDELDGEVTPMADFDSLKADGRRRVESCIADKKKSSRLSQILFASSWAARAGGGRLTGGIWSRLR